MDRGAWWTTVHGVARVGHDRAIFTFTFQQPSFPAPGSRPAVSSRPCGKSRKTLRGTTEPVFSQVSCLEVDFAHGLKAHHLLSTARAAGTLPSLERFKDAQNMVRSHT